jgi:hypothetical protein
LKHTGKHHSIRVAQAGEGERPGSSLPLTQVIYRNEDINRVQAETDDAFRSGGYYVDDVPPPEDNGKNYQMMYNPDTHAVYYEYSDPPTAPLQAQVDALKLRMDALQQTNDDLTVAMADMMGGATL